MFHAILYILLEWTFLSILDFILQFYIIYLYLSFGDAPKPTDVETMQAQDGAVSKFSWSSVSFSDLLFVLIFKSNLLSISFPKLQFSSISFHGTWETRSIPEKENGKLRKKSQHKNSLSELIPNRFLKWWEQTFCWNLENIFL